MMIIITIITVFLQYLPEVHQEPRNEVGSPMPGRAPTGVQTSFNVLGHS